MKGFIRFVLLLTLLLSLQSHSQSPSNQLVIGVLAPQTGDSSVAGITHNYWIQQGLASKGNIYNDTVKITPIFIDTQSNDDNCYQKLSEFLSRYENVAMIIGPVRSGCAKNLITNDISLPIISSLASATILTTNTEISNSWFFRANISDISRLDHFVRFIGGSREFKNNISFLIYDHETDYGLGLASDIKELISFGDDSVSTIRDGLTQVSSIRETLESRPTDSNVYILGGAKRVVEMATALQNEMRNGEGTVFNIFTVGMSQLYLNSSVDGLITIGEVGFRQNNSVGFESEYQRITTQANNSGHKFYPTIYSTARFIVPKALEGALSKVGINYQIDELRDAILNELKMNKQFKSLSPPDSLSFNNQGDLVGNFTFPIYELEPSFKIIDSVIVEPAPWIEVISQNDIVSFLESPISISLLGHNTDGFPIKVSLKHITSEQTYEETISNLRNNEQKTVSFHVIVPGDYLISSNRDIYPSSVPIRAQFSMFYFVCGLFSMIGVLTKNKTSFKRVPLVIGDWAQGIFFGVALAFISTYVKYSIVPVVETDWNLLNGAMYGFIGGFFGPWLLNLMAKKVGVTNS
jgi:ABC-type branched-subunit amino acid transport system substrate-binding protein